MVSPVLPAGELGDRGRRPRPGRRLGSARLVGVLLAVLAVTGCSRLGDETIRIGAAEREIEQVVEDIVAEVRLDAARRRWSEQRGACELLTGARGASSALSVRGPLPGTGDAVDLAAAELVEADYVLVEDQLDEGIFGRRDGIRITVVPDTATDELAIDAATGCRPLDG